MKVIATRNKKLNVFTFFLLLIGVVLSLIFKQGLIFGYILPIILAWLDVFILICLLQPKNAICKYENCLIFNWLFVSKKILISDIAYVNAHERNVWHESRSIIVAFYVSKNDVRKLTVAYNENGIIKQKTFYSIENASAVKTSIDALKNDLLTK